MGTIKNRKNCRHESVIDVRTHGLYRQVCDACGSVSFIFESDLDGEVGRDRFAREADELVGASR